MLFISLIPGVVLGQTSIDAKVLEITLPKSEDDTLLYSRVISAIAAMELTRGGLIVLPGGDLDLPVIGRELTGETVLGLARSSEADFVLVSRYSNRNKRIIIDLEWYDASTEEMTASAVREGSVDLDLDRTVGSGIEEILVSVSERLASLPKRTDEGAETVSNELAVLPGDTKPGEPGEGNGVPAGEISSLPPVTETPAKDEEQDAAAPRKIRHFEVSVGFAPFITTGEGSEYFKIGFQPVVYSNVRLITPIGLLCWGLHVGLNAFHAEGLAAVSDNFLIPVGADIRFILGDERPLGVFFRVAGGPSIFVVNSDVGQYSKIILYALGGIGINISFVEAFGMGIEASYTVFFEEAFPIMGFTPALYLFLRL